MKRREYRLSVAAGKLEDRKAQRLRIGAAEDRGLESFSPGRDAAVSANNEDKPGLASALRQAQAKAKAKKTNEEYTQVLEQMILSLTGMELEELHETVGGHLSEDWETPDHWKATNKINKKAALAVMKKNFPHLDPMADDGGSPLYHQYIPDNLVKAQGRRLSSNTVYGTGGKPVPAPTTLAGMKKLHPKLRGDDPFTLTTFVPKPGGKLGTKNTFRMPRY